MRVLYALDWLHVLQPVNFRDPAMRERYAPDLALHDLDRSMHIKLANRKTFRGFDAFRFLARHVPLFWPVLPFLHLPGVAPMGRRIYASIASRRKHCTDERCIHEAGPNA